MKKILLFLLFTFSINVFSQNLISVPFTNGFVGDNTANNQSTNAYYLSGASGLGWTNIQFAQSSTSNIFVAQGNDIIGMAIITDANGVEHTITGFVKWRAPSGTVTTLVFQPQAGSNFTLATNGFNGSSSYVINDTKYLGLTFNGQTLSISPVPGTVSGNAATNGLLDALNNYLGSLPSVSIQQTASVTEGTTTITLTVTLSASSSNTVSVNYATADGSAIAGSDYSSATGTVTFAPGQTSQTITITIINDSVAESTENFTVTIADPVNTSILNAICTVTITDNDSVPTISTSNNLSGFISCAGLVSSSQSFTISGTNLTNNVVVTAPTGYEVSLTSGSGYASSVTITASGTLATTTVYVRLAASATGSPSGNIAITSTGATTQNIAITGTVTAAQSAGTLSGTQAVCVGSTTTFSSTTSGGAWASSDTTVATVNASTGVITGVAAGTATITYTVTGTGGCADATATRTVTVTAAPSAGTLSGTQAVCVGSTTTFSSTTSGGAWTSSDTTVATVNASTGVITGVAAGTATITYTVTGTGGCADATATRTVTVTAAPSAGTLSGTQAVCVGSTTTFSSTTSGGAWTSSDTTVATVNASTGVITGVAAGTATITYTVTGTGGCADATATRTVTVTAAPSAGTLSGTQALCVGNTTTFSSTVSGGAWTSSDTTIATVNASTGVVTGVAVGTATITYTVTGTGGCADATATRTVTVTAAPSAGTLSGTQALCVGNTTTFSSTVSGGAWTSSDTTIATVNASTGVVTGVAVGTATITYTVTGTGGCADATTTRTVTVYAIPNPPIVSQATICGDVTNINSYVTVTSGHTLNVSSTPNTIPSISNVNAPVGQTLSTGIYTIGQSFTPLSNYDLSAVSFYATAANSSAILTVKIYSGNGTTGSLLATKSISNTVPGEIIFNLNSPIQLTQNQTYTFIVETNTSFSHTISWNDNGNPYSGGSYWRYGSNFTTSDIWFKVYKVASYQISQINTISNCQSSTVTITIIPSPSTGTLSGTQSVCVGNTTTFSSTVSGGAWTSSDTTIATVNASTGVVTGVAAGTATITYTVTGTGGCADATATRTVTVTAAPSAGTLSGTQALCVGNTTTFSSTVSGGAWTSSDTTIATVNASTGVVTGVAAGTATITYTVTGTGGCADATATRTVTVTAAPSAGTLSGTQSVCVGNTTTFSSTVSGGAWTSSDTTIATVNTSTGVVTGVAAGTATITYTVTGTGGCANASATRTVTVTAAPSAGTLSGTQSVCVGNTTTFSSTVSGGAWTSSDTTIATVNTSTGVVTGVAAGTATITYTVTGTGGCANASATRTVTVTAAPSAGTLSGTQSVCVGNTTIFSSTVSGGAWTSSDTTIATVNASTGVVTGVAAGTATITYTVTGTGGCANASATRTVTVTAAPSAGTLSGTQSVCVGNTTIFSSTVSGGAWTSSDTTIATVNASTGVVTGVAAGTATITYTVTGTGGCANASATRTVTVTAAPSAVTLSGTQSVIIGNTTTFSSTVSGGTWTSSNISIATVNASTGVVTGIAVGTATITYTVTGTGGCADATATRTVVVSSLIDAVNDTPTTITAGDTTSSVITNDILNGAAVVLGTNSGQVTLTGVTVPTGLTLNANGTITVSSGTPSGTYTLVYRICENGATPANCDTATVTIVVSNIIDAVNDTPTTITAGDTTSSILTNDTLDGSAAVLGTNSGQVTLTGVTVPTGLTLNSNGTITVSSGTPSGTYTLVYRICENGATPANCDTATVTIVVSNIIDAVNDTPTTITAGDTTSSVITNDILNGAAVVLGTNSGQVTLTGVTVPTGLTLNANGTITVSSGTPSGTYTLVYRICENGATPANCDTATVTIVVSNIIDAVNDTPTTITAGDTTSSILTNDTLDGSAAVLGTNSGQVTLTGVTVPTGLTLNSNGTITVSSGTPSGTYTLVYRICENGATPANCDTATVTIVVSNIIDAVNDTPTTITAGDTTSSVITNDILNGAAVVLGTNSGQVTLTGVTVPTGLTLNANGTITVSSGTPSGTYTLVYRICENGATPANCDTATVTIVVSNIIDAVNDTTVPVNGVIGTTLPSVIINDTLDGSAAVLGTNSGQVTLTGVTVPTGLTLNSNGTITVSSGTPSGTYTLVYRICENGATPVNCDTATVTVIIGSCLDFPINDCDGDGVTNGQEVINGTNPNDSCSFILSSQTLTPSSQWLATDCDGDGVTNGQEIIDGTNPLNPCSYNESSQTLTPSSQWLATDCDGDGVTNGQEIIDGTDPSNPCLSQPAHITLPLSQNFLNGDCDGDGLTNGQEIGPNPNTPFDPNGNGIPDYLEVNNHITSTDDLEIFNLVTPNGDGDNDVFVIRNIELYPENSLEIFNRWGVQVYGVDGYGQNGNYFRGISEGRFTIQQSAELPVGTYWYVLKYKNAQGVEKQRVGYLYINK